MLRVPCESRLLVKMAQHLAMRAVGQEALRWQRSQLPRLLMLRWPKKRSQSSHYPRSDCCYAKAMFSVVCNKSVKLQPDSQPDLQPDSYLAPTITRPVACDYSEAASVGLGALLLPDWRAVCHISTAAPGNGRAAPRIP